jgi:hypothetical protein
VDTFYLISKFPEAEGDCPNHVVVLYKGRFFHFSPFDDGQDLPWEDERIEQALLEVENNVGEPASAASIGALSCGDRDTWSQHFQKLSLDNPEGMSLINSAICIIVLTDLMPQDDNQLLKATLVNDGSDIWTDKSLSFVAFQNGLLGSQSEVCLYMSATNIRRNFYTQSPACHS